MSDGAADLAGAERRLGPARLGIGLAQGLVGLGLHRAFVAKVWPATEVSIYWALALWAALWPLILLDGLGSLRRRTLIAWSAASAVLILALGYYDLARQAPAPGLSPSPQAVLALVIALFVAQHLIAPGDAARKWMAPYPAYYDAAWKNGVQLVLAVLFVGVFWGVLELGAALFRLIGVKAFGDMIARDWFAYPATAVVFAGAVHLTDRRAGVTRGFRTVALALLSWLTPLMALIAAAFLLALPFTGLQPLWSTKAAAGVLLSAAAALIVLLNAAYHDGAPERRPSAVLRGAGRLAALLVIPLVAIAAYGIALRVGQHGWTPQRIIASACALVGAGYGLGYLVAAVAPGAWLKPLERTNVVTAFVILGVIVALFTPIADPARISVADQTARLLDGRTGPDRFDFRFLRFGAARFGVEALRRLQAQRAGPNAAVIARDASEALNLETPWQPPPPRPAELASRITVYPPGKRLPPGFLQQDWSIRPGADPCVTTAMSCDAFFADLDGDGVEEVLLASDYSLWAYKAWPDRVWRAIGSLAPMTGKIRQALRTGGFKAVESPWKDLQAGGRELRLEPSSDPSLDPVAVPH